MNNHVTIYEEYKFKFIQLPMVFFTSNRYKDMSNNSKMAWSLLRNRSSLSRKNNWFDKEDGKIFFIFTNEELMDLLNVKSKTTLSNIKKELETANLIEQKRMGFNRPNKIYLKYPEIDYNDIYMIDEFDNYYYEKETAKTFAGKGSPKNGRPKNGPQEVQYMDSINTELNNTDKELDTYDTETAFFEKNINTEKEKYMTDGFFNNTEIIPKKLSDMLKAFSRTPEKAQYYYDIILRAKKVVEKDTNTTIWLDNEPEIVEKVINAFSRSIRKIEKERKIKNPEGYIYITIRDLLHDEVNIQFRKKLLEINSEQ